MKVLISEVLSKLKISKWQRDFVLHLFPLWFVIVGRHNFLNIARYGDYLEDTYRRNFDKSFDFLGFNQALAQATLGSDCILAFDPTFISKSGKFTEGVGYYYSGCAGREKWGLEFSGIAAIDLSDKTALHLVAYQTLERAEGESLLDYYAQHLIKHKAVLEQSSMIVVVDAYFSKAPFIDALLSVGYEVRTRLRKDASMRYLYHGPRKKGRGRPKVYDGKIDPMNLKSGYFNECDRDTEGEWVAYEAVVNIKAWKRNVRLVVVHQLDENGEIVSYQLYISTNIERKGKEIKRAYQTRFQIEFIYRDGKQHLGLNHCQARSKEKLHFHINTALTCVNLAKVINKANAKKKENKRFSLANIKKEMANEFIFDRIISMLPINRNSQIIKNARENIRDLGEIPA